MRALFVGSIVGSILCGIVIALFQLGILQVHARAHDSVLPVEYRRSEKQSLKLFVKKNGTWVSEGLCLVLSDDKSQKVHRVVTQWLLFAFDEGAIIKPARVQTVFYDEKKNIFYISFDRSFFSKESCLHDNLMLIEGLLKTCRDNDVCNGSIAFSINYQPWEDRNLDFSQPWSVSGYSG